MSTSEAPQPIADRLAALADELRALADELRAGQRQAEPEPEPDEPEERTTSGVAALHWLNERHPAAPAVGHENENEELG